MDAHIHSKYSRATSQDMDIASIARFAPVKGLDVVGTGDFTHPAWVREIKETLVELEGSGLYATHKSKKPDVLFMLTAEVHTLFNFEDKVKKVHHVIWTPNVEVAEQVNEALSSYGSLSTDGRPTLNLTPPELVEIVTGISADNVVFPAHAWTPWFSIFGAFSGFDHLKDCYQDKSDLIFALETGLSSDPPMNWRVSDLDRLAIISNSDCHSYWPWRLGREANVLDLDKLTYRSIVEAVKSNDPKKLLFTIETEPAYGKYHWTGHRACGVSMPASRAVKQGNRCPVCGRKMTKGVEQRVEELADRPEGFRPKNRPTYVHLLPLSEILASAVGSDNPSSQKVWTLYNALVEKLGDEYNVLLNATLKELSEVTDSKIAELILRVREDRVKVTPGYDGVYGKLVVAEETAEKVERDGLKKRERIRLQDFM